MAAVGEKASADRAAALLHPLADAHVAFVERAGHDQGGLAQVRQLVPERRQRAGAQVGQRGRPRAGVDPQAARQHGLVARMRAHPGEDRLGVPVVQETAQRLAAVERAQACGQAGVAAPPLGAPRRSRQAGGAAGQHAGPVAVRVAQQQVQRQPGAHRVADQHRRTRHRPADRRLQRVERRMLDQRRRHAVQPAGQPVGERFPVVRAAQEAVQQHGGRRRGAHPPARPAASMAAPTSARSRRCRARFSRRSVPTSTSAVRPAAKQRASAARASARVAGR